MCACHVWKGGLVLQLSTCSRRLWRSILISNISSLSCTSGRSPGIVATPPRPTVCIAVVSAKHFKRPSCSATREVIPNFQLSRSSLTAGAKTSISSVKATVCRQSAVTCSWTPCNSFMVAAEVHWSDNFFTSSWSFVSSRHPSSSSRKAHSSACRAISAKCWVAVLAKWSALQVCQAKELIECTQG